MVLASACCSDDTRAYSATRNGNWDGMVVMLINLQHVVVGQKTKATSDAAAAPKRRRGAAATAGAPIRRRDQDTRVPNGSEAKCEPTGERNATGGGTWLGPPWASFGK